jgi:hypothetical protein
MTLYKELIRLHAEEGLSFANVVCFNVEVCGGAWGGGGLACA